MVSAEARAYNGSGGRATRGGPGRREIGRGVKPPELS